MTIGTSDGKQYEDWATFHIDQFPLKSGVEDTNSMPSSASTEPAGAFKLNPGTQVAGVFEQAQEQYPILKNQDIQYKESFGRSNNYLESWPPGEIGSKAFPRPSELSLDKFGIENFKPETKPIDILGDVVSHKMINDNPKIKGIYEDFKSSLEPWQEKILQNQYDHAKDNSGETRTFEDWKNTSGHPAYFRGYPFKQWSNPEGMYTKDQMNKLDDMMKYLKGSDSGEFKVAGDVVKGPWTNPPPISPQGYQGNPGPAPPVVAGAIVPGLGLIKRPEGK